MKNKIDFYSVLSLLVIPANFFLVVVLILEYFNRLSPFWNTLYIFYAVLAIDTAFLALKIKQIPDYQRNSSQIIYFSKYLFILSLIVLALNQFLKKQIIIDNLFYIIGLSIALGFLTFYSSHEKVEKIEDKKNHQENEEKKRKEEFRNKFPRLNKIWWLGRVGEEIYIDGKKTILLLGLVYIIFAFIQIYKLYHTGIGTDEGNFLYTIKLILVEHKTPYLDFYVREAGSLLFLIPWFKIFKVSVINLRWFIFIIHSVSFFLLYLLMKKISDSKETILTILLVSSIVLTFNGPFDFYQATFYQFYSLYLVLIMYLCYRYMNNKSYTILFIIGISLGVSILTYIPNIIMLALFPLIIIFDENIHSKLKRLAVFFICSLIPILVYFIYFGLKTDFLHIYLLVMKDILPLFISIGVLIFIISMVLQKIGIYKFFSDDYIILFSNLIIYLVFIYKFLSDNDPFFGFSASFYSAFVFSFGFFIILFQIVNLRFIYNLRLRKIMLIFYILTNLFFMYMGIEKNTFFIGVPKSIHFIAIFIFLVLNTKLMNINLTYKNDKNSLYIIVLLNLFLAGYVFATYIMTPRFLIILPLLPAIFLLSQHKRKRDNWLYFIIILSVIFSLFVNHTFQTNYTLYTKEQFDKVTKYITNNCDANETVFSLDTAILAEIKNPSILYIHSPFVYINKNEILEKPSYYYEGLEKKYSMTDLSLNRERLIRKIEYNKPKYIIGSDIYTFKLFKLDELNSYLNSYYTLLYKDGVIQVYIKK